MHYRHLEILLSLLILLVTVFFSAVAYIRWYILGFFVGSLFFVHWFGLGATSFIAVFVPVYYVQKRRRPQNIKMLLKFHIFGNLLAFMFISIHFAQNTGRLSGFYPRLEDGFVLFLVLSIIVATGMFERFGTKNKLGKYTKPVHSYAVVFFYFIMAIHVLQGFNII